MTTQQLACLAVLALLGLAPRLLSAQTPRGERCVEDAADGVVTSAGARVRLAGVGEAVWPSGATRLPVPVRLARVCSTDEAGLFEETTAILGNYTTTGFVRVTVPRGLESLTLALSKPRDARRGFRVFLRVEEGGANELHYLYAPEDAAQESSGAITVHLTSESFTAAGERRESTLALGWLR